MGYTQKPAECPFRKMRKILNSLFMVWFYLDYASVTNPRTGPCGSQLQQGYMRSCFSKCEMKLENQLKACLAINRISLITHFYGPCSSSHLFITVLCLAGILMRPETDRKTVEQRRTSNFSRSRGSIHGKRTILLRLRPTLCNPMDCIARQAPLSVEFSRQEYWRGLPCPPPGDNPKPGIESEFLMSLHLQGGSLSLPPPGKPHPCQGYPRIKGHQVLAPVLLLMSFSTLGKSLPLIKPQFPRLENEAV